jgi:hypothetical protein
MHPSIWECLPRRWALSPEQRHTLLTTMIDLDEHYPLEDMRVRSRLDAALKEWNLDILDDPRLVETLRTHEQAKEHYFRSRHAMSSIALRSLERYTLGIPDPEYSPEHLKFAVMILGDPQYSTSRKQYVLNWLFDAVPEKDASLLLPLLTQKIEGIIEGYGRDDRAFNLAGMVFLQDPRAPQWCLKHVNVKDTQWNPATLLKTTGYAWRNLPHQEIAQQWWSDLGRHVEWSNLTEEHHNLDIEQWWQQSDLEWLPKMTKEEYISEMVYQLESGNESSRIAGHPKTIRKTVGQILYADLGDWIEYSDVGILTTLTPELFFDAHDDWRSLLFPKQVDSRPLKEDNSYLALEHWIEWANDAFVQKEFHTCTMGSNWHRTALLAYLVNMQQQPFLASATSPSPYVQKTQKEAFFELLHYLEHAIQKPETLQQWGQAWLHAHIEYWSDPTPSYPRSNTGALENVCSQHFDALIQDLFQTNRSFNVMRDVMADSQASNEHHVVLAANMFTNMLHREPHPIPTLPLSDLIPESESPTSASWS